MKSFPISANYFQPPAGLLFPDFCLSPSPCPRSASERGSSSIPAPAPSAVSMLCFPRISRSFLHGTSPAEPAFTSTLCNKMQKGCSKTPVMGDRPEPWVYWQWEQPQALALGTKPQTPRSRISPGSCLKLWSSGLAAHKTAGFLAKGH